MGVVRWLIASPVIVLWAIATFGEFFLAGLPARICWWTVCFCMVAFFLIHPRAAAYEGRHVYYFFALAQVLGRVVLFR